MIRYLSRDFLKSSNSLRVYEGERLIFTSDKFRLLPLLEYIEQFPPPHQPVTIVDRVTGNSAALLSIFANCREVYSPLGSQLAIDTLDNYQIKHQITDIVPYIQKNRDGEMCPMEKLSIDKEPEEFYEIMRNTIQEAPS